MFVGVGWVTGSSLCTPNLPKQTAGSTRKEFWDIPLSAENFLESPGNLDFCDSAVGLPCSRKCQTEVVTLSSHLGLGKAVVAVSVVCGCW